MLVELDIRDFALIEHLQVSWTQGLNVLTGETGAGKSILIDALSVVLGERVGPAVIRNGADKAVIEATFAPSPKVVDWLTKQQLLSEDEPTLTISREISKSGSRARINGTLANLSTLQELRQLILAIHAQHEARTLLSAQAQLEMLDGLGDEESKQLLGRLRVTYVQARELSDKLKELLLSGQERLQRLEYVRFQLGELEQACLSNPNEDSEIREQLSALENTAQLEAHTIKAQALLFGEEGAVGLGAIDLIQQALCQVDSAVALDKRLTIAADLLANANNNLQEAARCIRKYDNLLETDPEALSNLQARLALLASIKRKYGPTLQEALDKRAAWLSEVDKLDNLDLETSTIEKQLQEVKAKLQTYAHKLSLRRRALASTLAKQVQTELLDLGMEQCQFEVFFEDTEIGLDGADHIDFLIAPNPGQPFLSVSKVASGGELSRVMLAIKTIVAGQDLLQTVVFDEIDTGLSGRVLKSVRDKLIKLSRSHQILCITHQPIVASAAHNHIHVTKKQTSTSTHVNVENLLGESRIQALASMAGGKDNEEEALQFARSLYVEGAGLLGP